MFMVILVFIYCVNRASINKPIDQLHSTENSPEDTNVCFKHRHYDVCVKCDVFDDQTDRLLKLLHVT